MIRLVSQRVRTPRIPHAFVAATLTITVLGGCSNETSTSSASGDSAAAISAPLSTSIQTPGGIWATLPMGHLNDPLNTFWQLFFRPEGSDTWSNQVEATAVGTNGGIVLTSTGQGVVLAGIRPSNLLAYSPLILSADAGQTWSSGVIGAGLAEEPDSLAAQSSDVAIGLVKDRRGAEVLQTNGSMDTWQALTDEQELSATSAGRRCGLRSITAVAYLGDAPVLGGSCDKTGVAGIFIRGEDSWNFAGPQLAGSGDARRVDVLGLRTDGADLEALLDVSSKSQTSLIAMWTSDGKQWVISSGLVVRRGEQLVSFGPSRAAGIFALLKMPTGEERLEVATPGAPWQALVTPPTGTATVAFGPSSVEAFLAKGSVLNIWSLAPGPNSWSRHQVLDVAIQYGSAS